MIKKINKIICIIPARGGSKGLPNKNILNINGLPLIAHSILYAKSSNLIDKIIVTTDSKKIAKISIKFGAEVPFMRPKKYSGDLSTTEETLKHTLLKYERISNIKFDLCVYLSPTDIFRKKNWLKDSIKIITKNKQLESVFVSYETHKNFWIYDNKKKWSRIVNWMKFYQSRQIRKKIYREDTGLCCVSRAHLWRKGKRIGDNVHLIINKDDFSSIDIHKKNDLDLANFVLKNKLFKP